uniref:Major facilitator superfamily (MFS) profile domain-containing protein n=1 Tax=Clastoptera arizonana TaxID=38151 RepID=A0A1B6CFK8_9HEMI
MGKRMKTESFTVSSIVDEVSPVLSMGSTPKFTQEQWLTLLAIGGVHFSGAICVSLQAPFYPQEAEIKGATASEYGLVFGSFEMVGFLTSPILGTYVEKCGVRTMLNYGMILAALSAISFGMLDYVQDHFWFITLSFILRMSESLGSTSALVAAFSITADRFPDTVATTFATLEVFYGIGYIVGPSIGGFLFSIGGFKLPFVVNGMALFFTAIIIMYLLPKVESERKTKGETPADMMSILKIPAVLLNSFCVVGTSLSMGFYTAILEPHLRQFDLTPVAMGLMFVISGGTYAVIAPIVGTICDKWLPPRSIISFGCLSIIISVSLVGPAPFLPIETSLELCIIGLIIHGIGLGSLTVPTFTDSICSSITAGFPDDITTYGILSGIWTSSFALGAFIGPSMAGILFDSFGFRKATLFVITVHALLVIYIVIYIIVIVSGT